MNKQVSIALKRKYFYLGLFFLFRLCHPLCANIESSLEPELCIQLMVASEDNIDYQDVIRAYNQLKEMGARALPILIQHLDDDRKSYGFFWGEESCPNKCQYFVGDVCYDIILFFLEGDIPKEYRIFENISKNQVVAWIKQHQQLPLREFQYKANQYILEIISKDNYNASIIKFWKKRLEARKNLTL